MYDNILVPVAIEHGAKLGKVLDVARRARSKEGQITVLTVVESIPPYMSQYMPEGQEANTRQMVRDSLAEALKETPDIDICVVSGHAGTAIVDYAVRHGVDCIVMQSHRPGLQDYFLGSTAARVVRHAPCSVHVVR